MHLLNAMLLFGTAFGFQGPRAAVGPRVGRIPRATVDGRSVGVFTRPDEPHFAARPEARRSVRRFARPDEDSTDAKAVDKNLPGYIFVSILTTWHFVVGPALRETILAARAASGH